MPGLGEDAAQMTLAVSSSPEPLFSFRNPGLGRVSTWHDLSSLKRIIVSYVAEFCDLQRLCGLVGYDASLTLMRSPVRTRAWSIDARDYCFFCPPSLAGLFCRLQKFSRTSTSPRRRARGLPRRRCQSTLQGWRYWLQARQIPMSSSTCPMAVQPSWLAALKQVCSFFWSLPPGICTLCTHTVATALSTGSLGTKEKLQGSV